MGPFTIIKVFQSIIVHCLYYSGLSWFSKQLLAKKGKIVLMFHGVSKKKSFKIPKDIQPYLDKTEFESITDVMDASREIKDPGGEMRTLFDEVVLSPGLS